MKILFTADWHIKLGQKNVPVDWAKNRYYSLFDQVCDLTKREGINWLIIGGDIFDKLPSMDELQLYFEFIMKINCPTIIYSGNHEALKKNTTFLSALKEVTSKLNKYVMVIDEFKTIEGIDFIPYNKLKEYYPQDIDFHSNILCTHVRGEILPHVKPEVDLEIFSRWDVVLAGDLHSYENCQRNILYPGSPLTTSFHRNPVNTGVIILDTDTLEHVWHELELPQLLRKTIKAGEEMPATEYHHTIYEVEGELTELASIQDSGLIDKKIVKRDTDTSLILEPEMSIETEVQEYLTYILQLNEETIDRVMKELNNHINKF